MTDSIRPTPRVGAARQHSSAAASVRQVAKRAALPDGAALLGVGAGVNARIARSGGDLAPQLLLDGAATLGTVAPMAAPAADPFADLLDASAGAFRGILGGGPIDDLFGR